MKSLKLNFLQLINYELKNNNMYFLKILYLSNMNFGSLDIYCNLQEVVNLIKKNCRVIHKKELRTPVSGFVFVTFAFITTLKDQRTHFV